MDWPLKATINLGSNSLIAFVKEKIVADVRVRPATKQFNHVQLDADSLLSSKVFRNGVIVTVLTWIPAQAVIGLESSR